MKKLIITLSVSSLCLLGYGQNTNYGINAGNAGSNNSAFGFSALDNVTGNSNTASGAFSLFGNTQGDKNTAHGYRSLYRNSIGSYNTGVGASALLTNSSGSYNTATGTWSLLKNTSGSYNTAYGMSALYSNTTGKENTSSGFQSMDKNTTGSWNTAYGFQSLNKNTNGIQNTASGYQSLYSNINGNQNTASGYHALYWNTSGSLNTAHGYFSLNSNTEGYENTASGYWALRLNTTGGLNTGTGYEALASNQTGFCNTAIGALSGPSLTNLNNSTALGCNAIPSASNSVRVGNTSVVSIGGEVAWTTFSDGRFKTEVQEDMPGLEFIAQLRPVSYVVDKAKLNRFLGKELPENMRETLSKDKRESGFIAQEVEAIVQKSGYTFSGVDEAQSESDIYGIRYSMFVVPLVKAVQELNTKVESQDQTIEELKEIIKTQQKNMNTLLGEVAVTLDDKLADSKLFSIYPNPMSEEATISMMLSNSVNEAKIVIYTLDGKELNSFPVTSRGKTSIQITNSQLQSGTYLYTLITDGNVVDTKRMILTQ